MQCLYTISSPAAQLTVYPLVRTIADTPLRKYCPRLLPHPTVHPFQHGIISRKPDVAPRGEALW